ncbi:AAA family ATPase [Terrimonas alba]|uniref:AAA family ATPase n=1 Tax=Terrimonas alba TaxID=3349636 RepID=UPI0035F490E1
MDNLYNQKVISANNVFTDSFLDAKMLYLYSFNLLPSINYIGQINGEKAFAAIREKFAGSIANIHQTRWYKKAKKRFEFDKTIIIMNKNIVLEVDDYYCEILHDGQQPELVEAIFMIAIQFKERQRRQPLEINLIVQNRNQLGLKAMEIKRTKLDLDLFYEDDFKETDEVIRNRLSQKNDKGIVLLHGLPGTGKTTYLRYLVGKIKKRVLFLSPSVAGNLMNPDFIELLIDNPNTVLIIEDAENIIMDRRHNSSSSVSNLLNISDGLLADFLNVQLICTFNSSLTMVDNALLRKGRLIAKYEFEKLGIKKAQRLSKHFGFDTVINQPMTIAEIANPNEKTQPIEKTEVVGFRRQAELMN